MASLGLAESGVFSLGVDLPQDRCVERRVWCCAVWRRPKTRDLHRLDHRFAIHGVLGFAKYDDRGFDLADLFGGRLPANLFYGTGIPACIVVIDKEYAQARKVIFMIDASAGYMKDGPRIVCEIRTSTRSSTYSTSRPSYLATRGWYHLRKSKRTIST